MSPNAPPADHDRAARTDAAMSAQPRTGSGQERVATAVVYCEANFGAIDGKTANGLVRHSEKYEILSVIDSEKAGLDAGVVLGEKPNGIPICRDLADALAHAGGVPDYFIFGMAPASGMLSTHERGLVLEAIDLGMNIVNGLHEFLNDDPEFAAASAAKNVEILDVRRPRAKKDLRMFSGRIAEVTCPRIAVLGTDCAIGKRTTATILTRALNDRGVKAVMVGTGQTGLIQGARYGIALDAVPSQFCSGELEATIVEAFEGENPDVIIIEGQGALSHPAYSTSSLHPPRQLPRRRRAAARTGTDPSLRLRADGDADAGHRDQSHPDLRRHEGHRPHDQPREHDRRRGRRGHHAV